MKTTLLLSLSFLLALSSPGNTTQPLSIDLNAGTQGAGISVGYKLNPNVRLRIRGAMLSYSGNENWSDMQGQLKLYGNNVGILVDMYPAGRNFYISAGLNFSENKMRCRARYYRATGMAGTASFGGTEYSFHRSHVAEITGKYSWNHAQPYLGIGYQDTLNCCTECYYCIDLGVNFMGSGNLTVGSTGDLQYREPSTGELRPVTNEVLERSIRKEGRDFFKIADNLCVYPVLQFSIGTSF